MDRARTDITRLLIDHQQGNREAFDRLMPLVYEDLKRLARGRLRGAPAGQTLNTSALIHEAYIRLVDQTAVEWQGRAHFFAVAARAMRLILVDYARERSAQKRGGGERPLPLDESRISADEQAGQIVALGDALVELEQLDARLARVVECRFFAGMTEEETAEALAMSVRSVQRNWFRARAWLRQSLDGDAT